ncbi:trichoplein keratin filament-binding protein-like [Diorhabda carinulata]|uniref:trichoplein keratin filament-binding protein-like n=1 Tax=Diorhabda carinulata TaxID=1163345 RepID=UPI0025A2F0C1|nr:trichoplein keratin filament-binding protein-like [Diorhabda carinulata]
MENLKQRGKHRIRAENEIIRRREQETRYNELWNGTVKYFDHWNKACTKFEEWTSPRYYSENNKLLSDIKNKKDKEEQLAKRREKLRQLFEDERQSYEIEIMVHKNRYMVDKPRRDNLEVSTNVLKEINDNIKTEEETKRRREAELKLYEQWKRNNPIVRQYEAKYKCRDLKLSWLDQQIEKQMAIEKEEEENRRILKEQEEKLKQEREKEEYDKKQLDIKREQLKRDLEKQILELREKQTISDDLKSKEDAELKQQTLLAELEEKYRVEENRRREQECVLFNIRQHKRKLQQRIKDIQEDLEQDRHLVSRLRDLELNDIIQDEKKRKEIQEGIKEFLDILYQQQKLEVLRKKRMEFLFDSEAKAMYDMQEELWKQEEVNRKKLIKEVIDSVKKQIQDNLERNKKNQIDILKEREEITEKIEQYHQELDKLKEEEQKKKHKARLDRQDEIKMKAAKGKSLDVLRMKELDKELELIRKEEERLQKEILRIQQRQGPIRPPRSRLFL